MGRDYSDEDRPSERDRARRHKKAKRHSRERSRERPAAVENGVERHSRREDKVGQLTFGRLRVPTELLEFHALLGQCTWLWGVQ